MIEIIKGSAIHRAAKIILGAGMILTQDADGTAILDVNPSSMLTQEAADVRYVNIPGDTMTGTLFGTEAQMSTRLTAGDAGNGRINIRGGGPSNIGYIEWLWIDGTRQAYMGFGTSGVTLYMENGLFYVGGKAQENTHGGRFRGWFTGGEAGLGLEVGISGGQGYVYAYNRTTAAFAPLNFGGSSYRFEGTGSVVLSATQKLFFDSDGDTYIYESSANNLNFFVGGTSRMLLASSYIYNYSPTTTEGGMGLWRSDSVQRGYVYWDTGGFGLLTNTSNWGVRVNFDGGTTPGGTLYGAWSATTSLTSAYFIFPSGPFFHNINSNWPALYSGIETAGGLALRSVGGVAKGWIYWDVNGFGFLNDNGANWNIRCNYGVGVGGQLFGAWLVGTLNILSGLPTIYQGGDGLYGFGYGTNFRYGGLADSYFLNVHAGIVLTTHDNYGGVRIYGNAYPAISDAVPVATFRVEKIQFHRRVEVAGSGWGDGIVGAQTGLFHTRDSHFGYSNTYRVIILGDLVSTYRTISLGVDVSANPSGAFQGHGAEIIIPNSTVFISPDFDNDGYLSRITFGTTNANQLHGSWTMAGPMIFGSTVSFGFGTTYVEDDGTYLKFIGSGGRNFWIQDSFPVTYIYSPLIVLGSLAANETRVSGRLTGAFGAYDTAGVLNWNDLSNSKPGSGYTLLDGGATNGPGPATYFHPFTFEYSTKDGSGNLTQFAIPYGLNPSDMWMRGRYSTVWSAWVRIITSTTVNSYAPTLLGVGATGTWVINITGDAGSLQGYVTATAATVNTIARRDASGDLYARYFLGQYMHSSDDSTSALGMLVGKISMVDGYHRSYSAATVRTFLSLTQGLTATDSPTFASVYTNNWFRSTGNTGWWSADFNIGIYAIAAGVVRTYNGANFLSEGYLLATTFVSATTYVAAGTYLYIAGNYGSSVVGIYDPTKYQGIYAMGDAYKLALNGSGAGTLYGLAWIYDVATYIHLSGKTLGHGVALLQNGAAMSVWGGNGMWHAGTFWGANFVLNSDIRFKTDIRLIEHALDKVDRLSGFSYMPIRGTSPRRRLGVSAQEWRDIVPEAVSEDSNGELYVDYDQGIPLLIEAVKELRQEVRALQETT